MYLLERIGRYWSPNVKDPLLLSVYATLASEESCNQFHIGNFLASLRQYIEKPYYFTVRE